MNTKKLNEAAARLLQFAKILADRGVKITEGRPYCYHFDFAPAENRNTAALCRLIDAARDLGARAETIKLGSLTNADIIVRITDPAAFVLDQFLAA